MPLMRDKETGVEREVHERYLARFPDEYEIPEARDIAASLSRLDGTNKSAVRLLTGFTDEQLDELGGVPEPSTAPKKRPADKSPVTPVVGAIETPDGEE